MRRPAAQRIAMTRSTACASWTRTQVYREVIPLVNAAAPDAVLLIVTDPPDPLAYLTRELAGHDRVLTTGTFLDSLRFRLHLGRKLLVAPMAVEAQVLGEHGTSQIFHWSGARVGGVPISEALTQSGHQREDDFRTTIENEVRYANITIIEGIGASQYGIGMVCAGIAEIVLRDERTVIPIGFYSSRFGVTLSLPGVVGREGCLQVLDPHLSDHERIGLEKGHRNIAQGPGPNSLSGRCGTVLPCDPKI
jgi:L-lactate dehydrogenase